MDPTSLPSGYPVWVILLIALGGPAIGVLGGILGTVITQRRRLGRIEEHAAVAAEQTANTHDTNLRDDLDEKFQATERRVSKVDRRVDAVVRRQAKAEQRADERHNEVMTRLDALIDGDK